MAVQLVNDRLDAQHQKLVTQMDPEFQTGLQTHGNRQTQLFPTLWIKDIKASVKVDIKRLKSCRMLKQIVIKSEVCVRIKVRVCRNV